MQLTLEQLGVPAGSQLLADTQPFAVTTLPPTSLKNII
jgi:hypothetical protein